VVTTMVQILSISANTAAMAIEALKHPRRISAKDQAKEIKAVTDRNARRLENASDSSVHGLVPALAVSIDVTSSGYQPNRQQAPLKQVLAAYREVAE